MFREKSLSLIISFHLFVSLNLLLNQIVEQNLMNKLILIPSLTYLLTYEWAWVMCSSEPLVWLKSDVTYLMTVLLRLAFSSCMFFRIFALIVQIYFFSIFSNSYSLHFFVIYKRN